jgi:hypothetical protein
VFYCTSYVLSFVFSVQILRTNVTSLMFPLFQLALVQLCSEVKKWTSPTQKTEKPSTLASHTTPRRPLSPIVQRS